MPEIFESMTKIRIPVVKEHLRAIYYNIRCWREETDLTNAQRAKTRNQIMELIGEMDVRTPIDLIAKQIGQLPRMNAVEVLDEEGDGVVYYREWP